MVGIESSQQSAEARPWTEATAESWDKVRETGIDTIDTVKHFGAETLDRAKSVKDKVSDTIADRKIRRRAGDEKTSDEG